jgi:poly(A) polymerase
MMQKQRDWIPTWLQEALVRLRPPARVWLVGGAVRDGILGHATTDFDFVVEGDSLTVARHIADQFQGNFYPLDTNRKIGRTILRQKDRDPLYLDFSSLMGSSIENDLRQRDFTINALAIDMGESKHLIDPCGGLQDLKDKVIRQCSPDAFRSDPIRVYRAIRFAVALNAQIEKSTLENVRQIPKGFIGISVERLRDEFFHILDLEKPATALRLLDRLHLLDLLLKTFSLQPSLVSDSLDSRISLVEVLATIIRRLTGTQERESTIDLTFGELRLHLDKFEDDLTRYLAEEIIEGRSKRELLLFAAFVCPEISTNLESNEWPPGRAIQANSKTFRDLGHNMRLSSKESNWLGRWVSGSLLTYLNGSIGRREMFRVLHTSKDTSPAVLLISLARSLTVRRPQLDPDEWKIQVQNAAKIFEYYFGGEYLRFGSSKILSGTELIAEVGMRPGPEVGRILLAIDEAFFVGDIHTQAEAIEMARDLANG